MKTSFSRLIPTLILLALVFPQVWGMQRQNAVVTTDYPVIDLPSHVSSIQKCASDKSKKAPCYVKVFSTTVNNAGGAFLPLANITKSYTCGVNVYTEVGILVQTLSETVSVTWLPYSYGWI